MDAIYGKCMYVCMFTYLFSYVCLQLGKTQISLSHHTNAPPCMILAMTRPQLWQSYRFGAQTSTCMLPFTCPQVVLSSQTLKDLPMQPARKPYEAVYFAEILFSLLSHKGNQFWKHLVLFACLLVLQRNPCFQSCYSRFPRQPLEPCGMSIIHRACSPGATVFQVLRTY